MKEPFTREWLSVALDWEINRVCGRVNGLIKKGFIVPLVYTKGAHPLRSKSNRPIEGLWVDNLPPPDGWEFVKVFHEEAKPTINIELKSDNWPTEIGEYFWKSNNDTAIVWILVYDVVKDGALYIKGMDLEAIKRGAPSAKFSDKITFE